MNIKDKIDQIKLAKVKVAVYSDNIVILGEEGQFPEPLVPNYIDIGDVLDEMLEDIAEFGLYNDMYSHLEALKDKYNL